MKLISCYIENFGGLSGYSVDFDENLTVIKEANGFGKTTLAAFIKAMFYGFPKNARTLQKNERKLYTPWQGGSFGGNLCFEHDGIRYRIERFFGSTPKQDSFTLYELDPFRESKRFSDRIGLELFQLDVESYEKSSYMAQSGGFESFATAGIQTKLGDLAEETDDMYNYDKAVAALREKRSKYKAYRGNGGSIYEINSKISKLQAQIAEKPLVYEECEKLIKQQDELISRLNENEKELETIRKRITEVSEIVVLENLNKQYLNLKEEKKQLNAELEKILVRYKKGLPTKERTDEAQNALDSIIKIDSALTALRISKRDQYIYEENRDRFKSGIPTDEELDLLQELSNEHISVRAKLAGMEEVKREAGENSEKKAGVVNIPLTCLGLVALIVGIFMIITKIMIPGISLSLFGVILAVLGICFNKKPDAKVSIDIQYDSEQEALKIKTDEISEKIVEFLKPYYAGKEIDTDDFSKIIAEFINDCNLYRNAESLVIEYEKNNEYYIKERDCAQKILDEYAVHYGLHKAPDSSSDFRKINEDIIRGEELLSGLEKKENQIQLFLAENGKKLNGFKDENEIDLNLIKAEETRLLKENNRLNSDILKTKQKIEERNKELEKFPKLEDELDNWYSRFEEDKKACEILDETMEFLQNAKDNLTHNYVNPVKERFESYVNQVLGENQFKVFIDKELEVRPEKYGEARELTYFSAGYTDIIRLCMHFALVDVLFKDSDCFVILDDPFVNLDDEKTKEAVELLRKLSRKRQIVYLVCNSSRI